MPTITPRTMKIFKACYPGTIPLTKEFIAEVGQIESKHGASTWISQYGRPFCRETHFVGTVAARDGSEITLPRGILYNLRVNAKGWARFALTWRKNDAVAIADLEKIFGQKFSIISDY